MSHLPPPPAPYADGSLEPWTAAVESFVTAHAALWAQESDVDTAARKIVLAMGEAGLLRALMYAEDGGRHPRRIESREIVAAREILGAENGLADFAFVMQGLGSYPLTTGASASLRATALPAIVAGKEIAAFAITEPNAGSDIGSMETTATRDPNGDVWVLNGEKTFISNAGIASGYTVFAKTSTDSKKNTSAFWVTPDMPGFAVAERFEVVAPHPIGRLKFTNCRVPAANLLGAPGDGMKLALGTLDVFRVSVAAAAVGMAARAIEEAKTRAQRRKQFGVLLSEHQIIRAKLAKMATEWEAARLLTWRAAWLADTQRGVRHTKEVAMAKLFATETAQRIIDECVQIHGGEGVRKGGVPERLYREIRSLRIYEGTSEIQHLVIAREMLGS